MAAAGVGNPILIEFTGFSHFISDTTFEGDQVRGGIVTSQEANEVA